MSIDPDNPEVLMSVPDDVAAAAIVNALGAHGIQAMTTGGYTAGFRAEAPGRVNVIVRQRDLHSARSVLADLELDHSEVDWSQVDLGDAEEG